METKECTRCHEEKGIDEFRTRPNGFTLNQCKKCESEMGRERRLKKMGVQKLTITSKSGQKIEASTTPIQGGRIATSPNTNKVLYFDDSVSRDAARVALSTFANVERTGIKYARV